MTTCKNFVKVHCEDRMNLRTKANCLSDSEFWLLVNSAYLSNRTLEIVAGANLYYISPLPCDRYPRVNLLCRNLLQLWYTKENSKKKGEQYVF